MNRKKKTIIPLNRVEGDLEIHIELEGSVVSEAWSVGTMYRGFENIMIGRAPLDGLVITPRICGICSTAHLYAAVKALDMIYDVHVPDNARRIRNVALMVEQLQNDMRHAFVLFMTDLANPVYKSHSFFEEALERYRPLAGRSVVESIRETRNILGIIAMLGGQWPHSSFMVPGGVVSMPSPAEIAQCRYLLKNFRDWYERRILGCSLERWLDIKSRSDLMDWLDDSKSHYNGDMGFFIRASELIGLDKIGRGHGNFISFGQLDMPENRGQSMRRGDSYYFPAGFYKDSRVAPIQQEDITEDLSHAWFDDKRSPTHPFEGETIPYATGSEGGKYSWAKAPRYAHRPAETGPLAEMMVACNPLFTDLVETRGPSVFTRELARLARGAILIPVLERFLNEMTEDRGGFYQEPGEIKQKQGIGLIEAPRGALGHWVKINKSKIELYQIITPTAWNGSPRDAEKKRGPWEEALVGTPVKSFDHPVELYHVVRSFDPCLVCTVHAADIRESIGPITM